MRYLGEKKNKNEIEKKTNMSKISVLIGTSEI